MIAADNIKTRDLKKGKKKTIQRDRRMRILGKRRQMVWCAENLLARLILSYLFFFCFNGMGNGGSPGSAFSTLMNSDNVDMEGRGGLCVIVYVCVCLCGETCNGK